MHAEKQDTIKDPELGALVNPDADARTRLIQAGLEAFGMYNYEGASTRELARLAGVNLSAIPYHFGGKQALYLAVIEHIAENMLQNAGKELDAARLLLAGENADTKTMLKQLQVIMEQFARTMLLTPEARFWARIILREQMLPTAAYDLLFAEVLGPALIVMSSLVARISGLPGDSPEAGIRTFTLFGQVLVFRAVQETVKRKLRWRSVDEEAFEQIRSIIHENTAAIMHQARKKSVGE
jgi:AcrR family transcriptional regulator